MNEHRPGQQVPIRLTEAQRRVVAEIAPALTNRLRLNEQDQRVIALTPPELEALRKQAAEAVPRIHSGMKRNSLRIIQVLATEALDRSGGLTLIPISERIYQFRVTLKQFHPPIWRRFQVRSCTLDKLHERIQTAMGWTNSHLNHFRIGEAYYADPLLMDDDFVDFGYKDSTRTKLDDILPRSGDRFVFEYEYDFGDSWLHEVVFEGCLRATPGTQYPICIEGQRACPPEDVGGTGGYARFLETIRDPNDEEHHDTMRWVGGAFDPSKFDADSTTKRMRRGIFNWRRAL
jgi:Plasmid pRiA4b ORF-3-like protein